MIKKLTSYLDYGVFAEIALTIFAVVFIAVVIRTLMTKRQVTAAQANIVLNDSSPSQEAGQ